MAVHPRARERPQIGPPRVARPAQPLLEEDPPGVRERRPHFGGALHVGEVAVLEDQRREPLVVTREAGHPPEGLVHELLLDRHEQVPAVDRRAPREAGDRPAEEALAGVLVEVPVVEEHVGDPGEEALRPVHALPRADAPDAGIGERLADLGGDVGGPDRVRVHQGDDRRRRRVPPLAQCVPFARNVGDQHRNRVVGSDLLAAGVRGVDHEDHLGHPVGQPRLDRGPEDDRVLLVHGDHDRHRLPEVVDDRPVEHRWNPPDQPAGPAEETEHAQGRAQHVVIQGQGHATSAPDMSRSTTESSSCPVSASSRSLTSTTARSSGMSTPILSANPRKPWVSFGRQTPP